MVNFSFILNNLIVLDIIRLRLNYKIIYTICKIKCTLKAFYQKKKKNYRFKESSESRLSLLLNPKLPYTIWKELFSILFDSHFTNDINIFVCNMTLRHVWYVKLSNSAYSLAKYTA